MKKEVSLVISRESPNYRKLAQRWYNLTDDQMIGMDVHHNPPRHKGGRNIPEHLFVYSESLHSSLHGGYTGYAREGARKAHEVKNEEGKSVTAVKAGKVGGKAKKTWGLTSEELSQRGKERGSLQPLEARQENGRKLGKSSTSQRWRCLVTGFVTGPGSLTRYQQARGIDPSNRIRLS